MEEQKPSFYANIPAFVRYNKKLSPNAKLLYGEITALCNQEGYCWSSNEYFSKLYEVSHKSVGRWITDLENEGYIIRELIYKEGTKEVKQRRLYLCEAHRQKSLEVGTKMSIPMDKNVVDNNTINNTINNNINTSSPKFSTFDMEASERLFELMQINNPTAKKPNLEKWANDVRLMRERDNRTEEQIMYLIEWSQNDSFWKSNILSTGKLREKFDSLVVKVKSQKESKQPIKKIDNKNNGYAAMDMMLNKFEGGFNDETSESTNNRILISENGSTF